MSFMNAVTWDGPDQLKQTSVRVPTPVAGEVLLRTTRVGICGSDVTILKGHHARAQPGIVLGHEFSGIVESAPGGEFAPASRVAVLPLISCRDRNEASPCVACRSGNEHVCARLGLYGVDEPGALASHVLVRARNVHAVPEDTPEGLEGLAEPLAVAVHAVSRSGLKGGESVAIFGGGPIGLFTALVARHKGAGRVLIVEPNPWRQSVAKSYGFDVAQSGSDPVEQVVEYTGGDGADIVFDSAGHPAVAAAVTGAARIGGTIMVVGVYKEPPAVDLRTVNFAELNVIGTRVYAEEDFAEAISLLAGDVLNVAALPTQTFPLGESAEAFAAAARGENAMKVFIIPTDSTGLVAEKDFQEQNQEELNNA
ncbi:zinc-dependent alcohol dehydrogenase [Paenarthrobacter nitroguajacolicus]|uniref:zinc-dependent alcohol dehydrogenase n=1 Tax=Paenarthrobacter nitroguajacolicus TaxID=211146 RepID=UPI0015B895B3|nr:zinc-binding dehydrogenase [Paenarthrobacter nitroguajacolicus]